MAGDWIPMRVGLAECPQVVRILSALCPQSVRNDADKCPQSVRDASARVRRRHEVIGALHATWALFDQHSKDGLLEFYSPDDLDSHVGINGWAASMEAAGWLVVSTQGLVMPDFDEWLSKSGKRRLTEAQRKRKERAEASAKRPQNVRIVADEMRTTEEKRTEEKSIKENSPTGSKRKAAFAAPSLEEVQEYVQQRGSTVDPVAFHAFYTANGWMQGRGKPIKDWRQAVITWERREASNGKHPTKSAWDEIA